MPAGKKHIILVIEQSKAVQAGIRRVNLGAGFDLEFINVDTVDELAEKSYAAVLVDDYLFNGPGSEPPLVLLKRKLSCPVVFMTSSGSPRAAALARESGVDGVLHKPFGASELRRILAQALEGNSSAKSSILAPVTDDAPENPRAAPAESIPVYTGSVAAEGAFDALFTELERRQPLEEGLDAFDVVERHLIRRALESTSGNQSQAARFLGITRNTLRKRIRKYGFADLLTKDDENGE